MPTQLAEQGVGDVPGQPVVGERADGAVNIVAGRIEPLRAGVPRKSGRKFR